jgi:hypothetical protein
MKRTAGLWRRHVVASAIAIGGLSGAVVAFAIDRFGSGNRIVWWAPAGTVAVVFAGVMVGLLFGEEIKGGREDATADAEAATPPDAPGATGPAASAAPTGH